MDIKLNGKALLGVGLLSTSLVLADFVSVVDVKSSGGITVTGGITETELNEAITAVETKYDAQISALETAMNEDSPVGSIAMWSSTTPPTGWVEMRGQSTSSYPELAAVIGGTIPDMRGVFARGWNNDASIDSGREINTYQDQLVQSHDHGINTMDVFNTAAFSINDNSGDTIVSSDNTPTTYATSRVNRYYTNAAGGTETRPKNMALMYIIKIQ